MMIFSINESELWISKDFLIRVLGISNVLSIIMIMYCQGIPYASSIQKPSWTRSIFRPNLSLLCIRIIESQIDFAEYLDNFIQYRLPVDWVFALF